MSASMIENRIVWYKDYKWQLVYIMLLGSIINYMDRINLSIANTTVRAAFGMTDIQMGFLLSAFMWSYALSNLLAGCLVDKFGVNKIFIWSLVLWSFVTVLGGFTIGFLSLCITRIILGVAESPFFIIGGKITQRYFTKKQRGVASSIINLGLMIANGFAPPLLTFLIIYFSWRGMFIILGVLGFLVVFLWTKFYQKNDTKYLINEYEKEPKSNLKFSNWALFKHSTSWGINLGNIGSSYLFFFYFTWLPTYLIDAKHLTLKGAGWVAAIPFIAGAIAIPIGGYLSDVLIKRGVNVIRARITPVVGGSLLAGITAILVNYVDNFNVVILLLAISTFAVSARAGVLWALVGDISPREATGTFGGMQNFANFIGGALAPIGTGYLLSMTGRDYNFVFIVSGILSILGSICYAMVRRPILIEEIVKIS